jgi:hypothetical protein
LRIRTVSSRDDEKGESEFLRKLGISSGFSFHQGLCMATALKEGR